MVLLGVVTLLSAIGAGALAEPNSPLLRASTLPYFTHTRNEGLAEQLANQPWRVLPKTERYAFAVDTYLFKPWGHEEYYYHGNGYWVNGWIEAKPTDDLALNMKLSAYNGASSYGYGRTDFFQPFFGVTWAPKFLPEAWFLNFRYFDLDRQTLGAGLLLEDKEMNGLAFALGRADWRFKGIIDGTGGFYSFGDLYHSQLDWRQGLVGASLTFINYQTPLLVNDFGNTQKVNEYGHLTWTLFSRAELGAGFSSDLEVGLRNQAWGGLVGLKWKVPTTQSKFRGFWHVQARHYGEGFADQIEGYVQQDYVTPEIEDKAYVEGRNLLARGDDVMVYATRLELEWRLRPWLPIASSNEVYYTDYAGLSGVGYLHKQSVGICPYPDRPKDCVQMFVANKMVNARAPRGGEQPTYSFVRAPTFGVNAHIYF